ncbi:YihY/virulence factor BrkB family protein [Paenibacillus tarimensis]
MTTARRFRFRDLLHQLYCRFRDDEVPALGAQLTYYLILSFFPFLIFLVTILGYIHLSEEELIAGITRLMPAESGGLVTTLVSDAKAGGTRTVLSIGMIATLWAASNGINAVIKGLNKAYDEEENRAFWKVRGISLLSTLVLVIIILTAMVMLVFGQMIGKQIFHALDYPAGFERTWATAKYVIPLVVMTVVFILLYKIAPNRRMTFREVVPGSLFATLGWIATSLLFSFYVNEFGSYTTIYGSLGGVILLLIWLYLSSIIILFGGEINAALAFARAGKQKQECKSYGVELPFFKKKK